MYCINTVSKNPWNYEQTEKAHFGEEKNDCTLFSIAKKNSYPFIIEAISLVYDFLLKTNQMYIQNTYKIFLRVYNAIKINFMFLCVFIAEKMLSMIHDIFRKGC